MHDSADRDDDNDGSDDFYEGIDTQLDELAVMYILLYCESFRVCTEVRIAHTQEVRPSLPSKAYKCTLSFYSRILPSRSRY